MLYYMDGRKLSVEERTKFERATLALQDGEYYNDGKSSNKEHQNAPDTWKFRVRNHLMFPPELEVSEQVSRVIEDVDEERAKPAIKGWTGDPFLGYDSSNNLTARVPAILDKEAREGRGSSNVYVGKSMVKQKEIVHSNTRMFKNVSEEMYKLRDISSPLERPHTPSAYSDAGSASSQGTFDVNGEYRTVQMTPLIKPGSEVGAEPMFTWGDISGTPMILDPAPKFTAISCVIDRGSTRSKSSRVNDHSNSDVPEFVMQPISRRESLGRDMSTSDGNMSSSGKQKRKHKKSLRSSGNERDVSNLTPAALKLARQLNAGSSTPLSLASSPASAIQQLSRNSSRLFDSGTPLGVHPNESPFGGSLSASYSRSKVTKR